MIDRSRQTAMPTPSSAALRFKRSLRAGASVLALVVAGFGVGMTQSASADEIIDGGRTITVPGDHASPWNYSGRLSVGGTANGKGTLNIVNGGVVSGDSGWIGDGGGANSGVVTVDGVGSTWRNKISLDVNSETLNIRNGGVVSSSYASILNAEVIVEGGGSQLVITNSFRVGLGNAPRALTIRDGGTVFSGAGTSVGTIDRYGSSHAFVEGGGIKMGH